MNRFPDINYLKIHFAGLERKIHDSLLLVGEVQFVPPDGMTAQSTPKEKRLGHLYKEYIGRYFGKDILHRKKSYAEAK